MPAFASSPSGPVGTQPSPAAPTAAMTAPGELRLRVATPEDAPQLLAVYAPYVRDTAITFEYEVPGVEEFAERVATTLRRHPYLVAVEAVGTEGGERIVGYAYAGPFHARPAYDWAVETSIYVDQQARGRRVGTRLLDALEDVLAAQGVTNAEACIAVPDQGGSVGFHERRGYRMVGHFEKCGFKHGRWWDMVWMEHLIAPHPAAPAPLVPFPELAAARPAELARILA